MPELGQRLNPSQDSVHLYYYALADPIHLSGFFHAKIHTLSVLTTVLNLSRRDPFGIT